MKSITNQNETYQTIVLSRTIFVSNKKISAKSSFIELLM